MRQKVCKKQALENTKEGEYGQSIVNEGSVGMK